MDIMSLADLVSTLTPDHLPKPAARSPGHEKSHEKSTPRQDYALCGHPLIQLFFWLFFGASARWWVAGSLGQATSESRQLHPTAVVLALDGSGYPSKELGDLVGRQYDVDPQSELGVVRLWHTVGAVPAVCIRGRLAACHGRN